MDKPTKSCMAPPDTPLSSSKGRPRQRRTTVDSQADRKRELDRIAQRMSRERSRNRIIFLEQKLKSLEACDRGGQISYLMKVIEDLRLENTQLRASLVKIRFIADDSSQLIRGSNQRMQQERHDSQSTSSHKDNDLETANSPHIGDAPLEINAETNENSHILENLPQEQSVASSALTTNGFPFATHTITGASNKRVNMNNSYPEYDSSFLTELANLEAILTAWWQPGFDWDFSNSSGPLPLAADGEKWNVSNLAFLQGLELSRTTTNTNPIFDPDVPIKAVFWGWQSVEAVQRYHPFWQALREVDERVFGRWTSKAQKIAMMYVCQLMMQYRASPTKANFDQVPPWFRPRPSQRRISHPLVIDFLIWPGIRDHLVFEHDRYAPDPEFSHRFCEDLRFNWPYPDNDIFCFDASRNTYTISCRFKQAACDLRNWTMDAKFFEAFEDLRGNVPMSLDPDGEPWQEVPASMPQAVGAGFQQGNRVQVV